MIPTDRAWKRTEGIDLSATLTLARSWRLSRVLPRSRADSMQIHDQIPEPDHCGCTGRS